MRLRNLTLERFGHFTDRIFNFGEARDTPDFHIIYGPNEAGKTTTMEAVLRLFYGFPNREAYAFKHQRNNLQVSGMVEIDGEPRLFTRLPKRSGSLVDATGTALPETALAAHLAGLTETDYRNLLCLDDDTIERGGEEIAQARGDIGRLLFSAAAGVSDLSTVLESVRSKADGLWRKRSSKTRMAELKRTLSDVEKEIRENDVSASAWRSLKKNRKDAASAEKAARADRDALRDTEAKADAKRRALPLIAEIDQIAQRILPFSDYPVELDFDPEILVAMLARESGTKADIDRLSQDINKMAAELDAIHIPPGLLDLGEKLDALDDLRSRDVTARLDLDRRRKTLHEAKVAMMRAARDLGAEDGTDPQGLVLSPAEIARLENAREVLREAKKRAQTEAREVSELTKKWENAKTAHDAATSKTPAQQGIADILARHDVDRLAPGLATARQAIEAAEEAYRFALEALRMGSVRFGALPDCSISLGWAQAWCDTHTELHSQISQAEAARARQIEETAARRARADQIMADSELIADVDIKALRTKRDSLWQTHLNAFSPETAQHFETTMRTFDDALDKRVAQARDLGQLRQIEQEHAEAQARADQMETRLQAMHKTRAALEAEVNTAASSVGLTAPISPIEWRDWVESHGAASEAASKLKRLEAMHQPTLERADRLLDALRPHLDLETPEFDGALATARAMAEAERSAIAAAATARETLAALADDLALRQEKHERAIRDLDQADAAWRNLVMELLAGAVSAETLLASLDPLRTLREHAERRAEAAQRVDTMQTDQEQFSREVEALAKAHDLASDAAASETFARLRDRADAAKADQKQARTLTSEIEKSRKMLTEKQQQLDSINKDVIAMGRIFPEGMPVNTLDALREATAQAKQYISGRNEKAKLERAVLSELGSADMDAARDMLQGVTLAALEAEAETVKTDLIRAESRLTEATETRVTADQALARVTGEADIARLTERKATLELELEETALEHLELSLGHRLADEAIRRYRDTHRSGMMAATERCFAALTNGAYVRLTTQPDGADETLLAVDETGTAKRVAEMSKGTRFQLYLALRASAHEQLVTQGTCLPFFCDDIFETFDEERTRAACRVMEQIGRSGQAIYLTHHRHVVDIARQVCDKAPMIHEI